MHIKICIKSRIKKNNKKKSIFLKLFENKCLWRKSHFVWTAVIFITAAFFFILLVNISTLFFNNSLINVMSKNSEHLLQFSRLTGPTELGQSGASVSHWWSVDHMNQNTERFAGSEASHLPMSLKNQFSTKTSNQNRKLSSLLTRWSTVPPVPSSWTAAVSAGPSWYRSSAADLRWWASAECWRTSPTDVHSSPPPAHKGTAAAGQTGPRCEGPAVWEGGQNTQSEDTNTDTPSFRHKCEVRTFWRGPERRWRAGLLLQLLPSHWLVLNRQYKPALVPCPYWRRWTDRRPGRPPVQVAHRVRWGYAPAHGGTPRPLPVLCV